MLTLMKARGLMMFLRKQGINCTEVPTTTKEGQKLFKVVETMAKGKPREWFFMAI